MAADKIKKVLALEELQYFYEKLLIKFATDENKADKEYVNEIFNTYILNIDYDATLAFDTSEIIFGTNTSSVLGQAILGQMVLAQGG